MPERNSFYGPLESPAVDAGWDEAKPRVGFFTDTSVCIGCKACEVACKEWNLLEEDGLSMLGMSYDNTGMLSADTWRHVAFIEQKVARKPPTDLGMPQVGPPPTEVDPTAMPGIPLASGSSRTPPCASAARPARSPARNGTTFRRTGST